VSPFVKVAFTSSYSITTQEGIDTFGTLGALINQLANSDGNLRAINMSMGYLCGQQRIPGTNPPQYLVDPALRADIMAWGDIVAAIWALGARPLVVTTAGNASSVAEFNNPFAYAALVHAVDNILVVENIMRDRRLNMTSCAGGHIAAPGTGILSAASPVGAAVHPYQLLSGTSMAAPHVTGTIAYLYSLQPGLSKTEVLQLLENNRKERVAPGDVDNGLDAWAAAMDIDRVCGGDDVLRMLVDIDDGSPDGNQRLNYSVDIAASQPGDDPTIPSVTINGNDDMDGDGGIGDDQVDMSDYRRARDWAIVAALGGPGAQSLDGPLDSLKHDANRNGVVEQAEEAYYPRNDFNGDGNGSGSDESARVPGILGGLPASDLSVLQELFQDPLYDAGDLSDFGWNSVDLHLALYWFSHYNDSNGDAEDITSVSVRVTSTDEPPTFDIIFALPVPDAADPEAVDVVLSMPNLLEYEVEVCGGDVELDSYGEAIKFTAGQAGTDHYFSPRAFPKSQVD